MAFAILTVLNWTAGVFIKCLRVDRAAAAAGRQVTATSGVPGDLTERLSSL